MARKIKDLWDQSTTKKVLPTSKKTEKNRLIFEFIGAADDRGVKNVGGRIGASRGPDRFREIFSNFALGLLEGRVEEFELKKGFNVDLGKDIQFAHDHLRKTVAESVKSKAIPIVIGGGHDFGYPHCAGIRDALGDKIALINIDAHLDVRPVQQGKITSGSPFYLAIEAGILHSKNFIEFGIQDHCNGVELFNYAKNNKIPVHALNDIRNSRQTVSQQFLALLRSFSKQKRKIIVSFDLDAIQMAFSPAVSAVQTDGFSAEEFLQLVRLSGECKDVVSVGFFEYAPDLDERQLTGRLLATSVHQFILAALKRI